MNGPRFVVMASFGSADDSYGRNHVLVMFDDDTSDLICRYEPGMLRLMHPDVPWCKECVRIASKLGGISFRAFCQTPLEPPGSGRWHMESVPS